MKRQAYTIESLTLDTNGGAIEVECADVTIINYGTSILTVNGIRIPPPATPGQWNALQISGNTGELDVTKYRYSFSAGGTNDATLVKRNYAGTR